MDMNEHIMQNSCRTNDRHLQGRADDGCRKDEDRRQAGVFTFNARNASDKNREFRKVLWTGEHLQITVMRIPCGGEIGTEVHSDTDQMIRVENGCAMLLYGRSKDDLCNRILLRLGECAIIPRGAWHNVINMGRRELLIFSVYAK